MQLSVNTDDFIYGDEHVIDVSENAVRTGLAFLADRLTRVEVHLKDQNADKHAQSLSAAPWRRGRAG